MEVLIWKARRMLESRQEGRVLLRCPIALGREPVGPKEREGDGRTPEGTYYICLIKEAGKYGKSLGLSYPSPEDAERGLAAGLIDEAALVEALRAKKIAGAALDVYEHEPPQPDDPLLALDNVTLTPHMAGGSNDAFFNTPILLRKRMEAWIDQH